MSNSGLSQIRDQNLLDMTVKRPQGDSGAFTATGRPRPQYATQPAWQSR